MDGERSNVKAATIVAAPSHLEQARFGFHQAFPDRSAKRRLTYLQMLFTVALIAGVVWAFRTHFSTTATVVRVAAYALFVAVIASRFWAAANLTRPRILSFTPSEAWPTYTILCPLYREANVLADLMAALARLDYPTGALQIQLLIEADDIDTITAAVALTPAPHIEIVLIPSAAPRTKPKALNVGLARARGDYVVVYDAEDRPHPLQLRAALRAFTDGDARLACVQAPLLVDNGAASWISRHFAAEYAMQFLEMLPLLARLKLPLPLGGTSNHFRTAALRDSGGWDPNNVTEDADLGYRLARDGWRSDVIAPATYEEAPIRFEPWVRQRARWIKGHLQTWLILMRNPFRTAHEMGGRAFGSMQLILAGGLASSLVHGPLAAIVAISVLSPYKLLTTVDVVLVLCGYLVAMMAALTASALSSNLSHARAALTMPFYWPLASIAAYRALWELLSRPHHWNKTTHGVSLRSRMSTTAGKASSTETTTPMHATRRTVG